MKRQDGFTLLELLITIAVAGILLALSAGPNLMAPKIPSFEKNVIKMRDFLRRARNFAVSQYMCVNVQQDPNNPNGLIYFGYIYNGNIGSTLVCEYVPWWTNMRQFPDPAATPLPSVSFDPGITFSQFLDPHGNTLDPGPLTFTPQGGVFVYKNDSGYMAAFNGTFPYAVNITLYGYGKSHLFTIYPLTGQVAE